MEEASPAVFSNSESGVGAVSLTSWRRAGRVALLLGGLAFTGAMVAFAGIKPQAPFVKGVKKLEKIISMPQNQTYSTPAPLIILPEGAVTESEEKLYKFLQFPGGSMCAAFAFEEEPYWQLFFQVWWTTFIMFTFSLGGNLLANAVNCKQVGGKPKEDGKEKDEERPDWWAWLYFAGQGVMALITFVQLTVKVLNASTDGWAKFNLFMYATVNSSSMIATLQGIVVLFNSPDWDYLVDSRFDPNQDKTVLKTKVWVGRVTLVILVGTVALFFLISIFKCPYRLSFLGVIAVSLGVNLLIGIISFKALKFMAFGGFVEWQTKLDQSWKERIEDGEAFQTITCFWWKYVFLQFARTCLITIEVVFLLSVTMTLVGYCVRANAGELSDGFWHPIINDFMGRTLHKKVECQINAALSKMGFFALVDFLQRWT